MRVKFKNRDELNKNEAEKYLLKYKKIINDNCWVLSNWNNHDKNYPKYKNIPINRISMWLYKEFDLNNKLLILHKCDNIKCWNPEHLFLGTYSENTNDAINKGRKFTKFGNSIINKNKTHCKRGHELSGENLIIQLGYKRCCKTCKNEKNREWRLKQHLKN